nr:O-antigen ligase family protein [Lachnospiraceae bacterium]
SVIDWFVIAFGIVSILSFLFSPNRTNEYPTFFLFKGGADTSVVNLPWEGYTGWNMGLRSQLMFVALYFLASRLFMKSWWKDFLYMMLGSAFIVFFLGVLHRFNIDPLTLYENLDEYYRYKFLSTLGQSSWYSSFMVVLMPLGMAFFLFEDNKRSVTNILLGAFVAVSGATFVTQNSDSAYPAFAAIVTIMFAISFMSNERFLKFWEMLIIFVTAMKVMGVFQLLFPQKATQLDSLSIFMSQSVVTWILLIVMIAAYILFRKMVQKNNFNIADHKSVRNIIVSVIIAAIPISIIITILNTKGIIHINALQDVGYLTFNDYWGNLRGYTWRNTVELMGEEMWRKMALLGPGPDCYATIVYATEPRATEIYNFWNHELVVCAHNEWLNMLFNEGILGLISYLGIFVSALIVFLKKAGNPVMTGCAASVAAYFFHNMFCYQQILCTPMIFLIMALGVWWLHENSISADKTAA